MSIGYFSKECRMVDLKELGVDIETFDIIYRIGEEDGRSDAINECIKALEEYKQEPMTDPYEIDECIGVLNKIKH